MPALGIPISNVNANPSVAETSKKRVDSTVSHCKEVQVPVLPPVYGDTSPGSIIIPARVGFEGVDPLLATCLGGFELRMNTTWRLWVDECRKCTSFYE